MAITNLITGKSLGEEILNNQETLMEDNPMPEEMSELPPKTSRQREKKSEFPTEPKIPIHTMLYLMDTMEKQLGNLNEVLPRLEKLLAQEEKTSNQPIAPVNPNRTSDLDEGEIAAELSRLFDEKCKEIVDQRLSDAERKSDRLCDRLSRTVRQATGIRRLIVALLILSGITLTALVFAIFLLLTQI